MRLCSTNSVGTTRLPINSRTQLFSIVQSMGSRFTWLGERSFRVGHEWHGKSGKMEWYNYAKALRTGRQPAQRYGSPIILPCSQRRREKQTKERKGFLCWMQPWLKETKLRSVITRRNCIG